MEVLTTLTGYTAFARSELNCSNDIFNYLYICTTLKQSS